MNLDLKGLLGWKATQLGINWKFIVGAIHRRQRAEVIHQVSETAVKCRDLRCQEKNSGTGFDLDVVPVPDDSLSQHMIILH